jgi:hypothetical protein
VVIRNAGHGGSELPGDSKTLATMMAEQGHRERLLTHMRNLESSRELPPSASECDQLRAQLCRLRTEHIDLQARHPLARARRY